MQGTLRCLAYVCCYCCRSKTVWCLTSLFDVSCICSHSSWSMHHVTKASLPSGSVLSDCCTPFTVYSESAHSMSNLQVPNVHRGKLPYPQLLLLRFIACLEEALHLIACVTGHISTHSLQQDPANVPATVLPVTQKCWQAHLPFFSHSENPPCRIDTFLYPLLASS